MTNLNPTQRAALQFASRKPDHPLFGKPNDELESVINRIREDQPEAFHTDASLKERVFIHKPLAHVDHWYSHRDTLNNSEIAQQALAMAMRKAA